MRYRIEVDGKNTCKGADTLEEAKEVGQRVRRSVRCSCVVAIVGASTDKVIAKIQGGRANVRWERLAPALEAVEALQAAGHGDLVVRYEAAAAKAKALAREEAEAGERYSAIEDALYEAQDKEDEARWLVEEQAKKLKDAQK